MLRRPSASTPSIRRAVALPFTLLFAAWVGGCDTPTLVPSLDPIVDTTTAAAAGARGRDPTKKPGKPVRDPVDAGQPVEPEPAPVEPAPVEPAPVEPAPVEPAPVEPAPVEPAPVEPAPVEPSPVEPSPVEPSPVEPAPVEPAPVEPVVTVPTAPVDLVATAVGPRAVDLTWTAVPNASSGYRVFRDGVLVATSAEPRYEDRNVLPGTTYSYTVSALNTAGESPRSSAARVTTPAENTTGDVVPGALRTHATIESIGLEWDLTGDLDHDATASVRFRPAGGSTWRDAMPLMRIDFNGQNMLAGSLLFLQPGTAYDLVLTLTDPDGGTNTQQVRVTTRTVPVLPTDGRTFHVVPGSGGGDGSAGNPFRGVAAASAVARAGDVMLLHAGNYGGRISFTGSGQPGRHIAWKAAGDGAPTFAGIEVRGSHVRIEGLRITAGGGYDYPIGIRTANAPKDVAIVRNTVVENHKAIYLTGGGSDWYIADNVLVGDNTVESGDFSGEGVELNHTAGHVVAHNSISLTGDGVSYCDRNCDINGNDIFNTSDDGIEPDGGFANIRMWGNRMQNTGHNGVSFQPQSGAPWYVVRNQFIGHSEAALKFRGTDRFVFAHNTVVEWTDMTRKGGQLLTAFSRNNVWISVQGGTIWNFEDGLVDWRTDLDYDGFDWGGASSPFRYGGSSFRDIPSFATRSGQQRHGVALPRSCFPTLNVPNPPPATVPPQSVTLSLTCPAIDAGALLPGLNDDYMGAGPDLGAFEKGGSPVVFGPR